MFWFHPIWNGFCHPRTVLWHLEKERAPSRWFKPVLRFQWCLFLLPVSLWKAGTLKPGKLVWTVSGTRRFYSLQPWKPNYCQVYQCEGKQVGQCFNFPSSVPWCYYTRQLYFMNESALFLPSHRLQRSSWQHLWETGKFSLLSFREWSKSWESSLVFMTLPREQRVKSLNPIYNTAYGPSGQPTCKVSYKEGMKGNMVLCDSRYASGAWKNPGVTVVRIKHTFIPWSSVLLFL